MSIDKEKRLTIRFPNGGVNRRAPFVGDKMYTCYDALNVWGDDPTREQDRGGSRPGISTAIGSSDSNFKIRAISNVGWKDSGVNHRGLIWVAGNIIYFEEEGVVTEVSSSLTDHGRTTIAELNQKAFIAKGSSGEVVVADPLTQGAQFLVATAGAVPTNCNIVATWRGRLVLADGDDPTEIFFSRIGDPYDWDYDATDNARATKLSLTRAGVVPQPVRCLVPNTDDCMIVGCDQQIWVLRGDPVTGGTTENLSDEIGILDSKAFCKTPDSSLVIMSQDGLYWMPPGCGSPFTSVSREVLPKELRGIDRDDYAVSMCYDQPTRHVFLFVTNETSTGNEDPPGDTGLSVDPGTVGSQPQAGGELITNHFAIDIRIERDGDITHPRSSSFWPMDFVNGSEPTCCVSRYREGDQPYAVFGTRDGKIRNFEWGNEVDDTVDYESYIVYGPIAYNPNVDVMLKRIHLTLARDSNPVTVDIFSCDAPEDIDEFDLTAPHFTATFDYAKRGYNHDVRLRGRCFFIIIRSIDKRLWAIDNMVIDIANLGRSRVHRGTGTTSTGPDPIP